VNPPGEADDLRAELIKRRAARRFAELRAEGDEHRARQLNLVGGDRFLLSQMLLRYPMLADGGLS
jgi:hypothetical protein